MKQLFQVFLLILAISFVGCSSQETTNEEKTNIVIDSLTSADSLGSLNKTDTLGIETGVDTTSVPITKEAKAKADVKKVMEKPKEVVDKESGITAEDLTIEEDYDVSSLEEAFNQLKPSLARKAQKAVMNTIQMDFSDKNMKSVVKGKFQGESKTDYSVRSYMNRLTMVGPYVVKVKDLKRDGAGKITSITVEETANLNQ